MFKGSGIDNGGNGDPIKTEGENSTQNKFSNESGYSLEIIEREPYTPEELEKRKDTFEEQKKLADEVCMKYKKGDTFSFFLEKMQSPGNPSCHYAIIFDGVEIGDFDLGIDQHYMETERHNDERIFYGIELNKNIRNKGLGKQLYILLNEYLKKNDGVVLAQAFESSSDSKGVWLSLFKDGLVELIPENSPHGYYLSANNHYLPKHLKFYRFKK